MVAVTQTSTRPGHGEVHTCAGAAHGEAARVEDVHGHLEAAAHLAKHVLCRHGCIVEEHLHHTHTHIHTEGERKQTQWRLKRMTDYQEEKQTEEYKVH